MPLCNHSFKILKFGRKWILVQAACMHKTLQNYHLKIKIFWHIVVLWIGCMLAAGLAFLCICGHLSTELLLAGENGVRMLCLKFCMIRYR